MSEKVVEPGSELDVRRNWPSPQELHKGFVPGNLVPPPTSYDSESIELVIDDSHTAHVGEHEIVLGGTEIFLLNALLLQRDRPLSGENLKDLGFVTHQTVVPQTVNNRTFRSTLENAYDFLSEQLNANGFAPLVSTQESPSGERLYQVNPHLMVTDKRTYQAPVEARMVPTPPIQPKKETTNFVLQHGLRTEKKPFRDEGDLYARLVTPDRVPAVPMREGAIPIEIEIVDNTTLRVGEQTIRLGSHQRYLFNALMLLRDQVNAAGDLKEFGFYPGAKDTTSNQTFYKSINGLLEQLNDSAGVEIIKKMGQARGTRYVVNPNLLLSDIRTEEELAQAVEEMPSSGSSAERRELKNEGDLYQRLIDVERIPTMTVGGDGAIEVSIFDNTSLKVGTHTIQLDKHERYLFNALMLLRESPATAGELKQFGFFPDAQGNYSYVVFSKTIASLEEKLSGILGVEIIKKIGKGRGTSYAVNPNLVLADIRSEEDKEETVVDVQKKRGRPSKYPELEEGYMPNSKKSNYKGPAYEGYGADAEHYDDNERRTLLITELIQRYKDHPQVELALHRLNNGAPIHVGPEHPYYRYIAEIGQYDLLDPSDEVRLFKILNTGVNLYKDWGVHADNEQALIDAVIARQIVYLSNLRLVVDHAKTWAAYSKSMSRLDYIQEGNIGLADAIDRFDYTKGFKFSTYATWWVRQRIQRSQGDKDRLIRIPVHMHDRLVNFSKTVRELTNELDRDPNPWEIAHKLGESLAEVLKLQGYINMEPASLNALIEDSGKGTKVTERIDLIADPNDEIAQATQEAEDEATVEALFSKRNLTLSEKYVLSYRLGFVVESLRGTVLKHTNGDFVHYDDLVEIMTDPEVSKNTLEEAGQLFGVTRERIRQIEKIGLDKIRLTYGRDKK